MAGKVTRAEYARAKNAVNNMISSGAVTKNSNGSYTINTGKKAGTTIGGNSGGSAGSSGGSAKTITGGYMQNGKLYNEYSDGTTGLASEWKGGSTGSTGSSGISNGTKTITGGYMQNGKLYNEYSDGSTGLASEWKGSISSSSNPNNISGMQFGQGTSNDYQKSRNENLGKYYSGLGKYDYNTIYNDLSKNSGFASASEADKKNTVNRIMEQAANASGGTLNTKSAEEEAAEQSKLEDEDIDYINDIINGIDEEGDEEFDYHDTDEWKELTGMVDALTGQVDSLTKQLESNTVKTSVPEERDTSYDYNTYYKENLAPDNNYENGESKNTLNDKPQTTLVSQYQEPVSTALNDLGLLTPNEEAAQTPNVEEAVTPKQYNSGDDIVQDFVTTLDSMGQEGGIGLTPQAVAQTYVDFKNQLQEYANNNKLSKEEYDALLAQLKNNETLNAILKGNNK